MNIKTLEPVWLTCVGVCKVLLFLNKTITPQCSTALYMCMCTSLKVRVLLEMWTIKYGVHVQYIYVHK